MERQRITIINAQKVKVDLSNFWSLSWLSCFFQREFAQLYSSFPTSRLVFSVRYVLSSLVWFL